MTKNAYDFPSVGCYVDESSGSADDCNRRTIEFAEDYGFETGAGFKSLSEEDEDYEQFLSEEADEAVNFLNGLESRSFMYWAHDDNSLYLMADVDGAKEDVGFVSGGENSDPDNGDYPAPDYRGEWMHVSDHGNATLYVRTDCKESKDGYKDEEIWGVV